MMLSRAIDTLKGPIAIIWHKLKVRKKNYKMKNTHPSKVHVHMCSSICYNLH